MTNELRIGGRLLVVFDGRCGFCTRAVRWFVRRARRDRLTALTALAALAEPLRRRLYLLVTSSDAPVSRDSAAEALGVPQQRGGGQKAG